MIEVSGTIRFRDGSHAEVEIEVKPISGSIGRISSVVIAECVEAIRPTVLGLVGKMVNLDRALDNAVIYYSAQDSDHNVDFFVSADNRSP